MPVPHLASARTVEVYHVQSLQPSLFELLSDHQGVVCKLGYLFEVALTQAHTFPVDQIDGGDDVK